MHKGVNFNFIEQNNAKERWKIYIQVPLLTIVTEIF